MGIDKSTEICWKFERRMRTRRGRNGSSTLIIGRENPSIPWQPNFPRGFCHAHTHTHALFFESTSKLESYDDVLFKSSRLDDDASPSVTARNIYLESYLHPILPQCLPSEEFTVAPVTTGRGSRYQQPVNGR